MKEVLANTTGDKKKPLVIEALKVSDRCHIVYETIIRSAGQASLPRPVMVYLTLLAKSDIYRAQINPSNVWLPNPVNPLQIRAVYVKKGR